MGPGFPIDPEMTVAVIITTRNRAADLAVTLDALAALRPPPSEILVTLDGCTDDTPDVVARRAPDARVWTNTVAQGSIPARDRMIRAANADLVLSLDDDSNPVQSDFIAKAAALFEHDPRLAVLWFPQHSDEFPESLRQADFGPDRLTASYVSSGAIIRRSSYLDQPGYAVGFGHAYEEPDYALQCIAAGRRVRLHTALTIRHRYSAAQRNEMRTHHLHSRNECWSVLLRCPSPWWPLVLLRRAAGQFAYACKRGPGWVLREPVWWWRALRGARNIWRQRHPVSWESYRRWRQLLRRPRVPDSRPETS